MKHLIRVEASNKSVGARLVLLERPLPLLFARHQEAVLVFVSPHRVGVHIHEATDMIVVVYNVLYKQVPIL